ncbi:MAG: phosphatidylglycerol lysyltransferase domain-containing protein [Syntrophales bacterium]
MMKKLTRTDYPLLKPYFAAQPYGLCTYSLPSLIVWSNHVFQTFYAIENDSVIIANESGCRPEENHLLLPVGPDGPPAPEELAALAAQTGYLRYGSVPEDYLEKMGREKIGQYFIVSEQPEYDDYVYLTGDLSQLKGNRYAKKRNLLHQFSRDYLQPNRVVTGPITPAVVAECLECLEKWCEIRNCDIDEDSNLACEKEAVINALHHGTDLDMKGLYVRIDGGISAFCISSHLRRDMGVMNFEKALPHIRGLYQYLDNECAQHLFNGYLYINKESDMGLAALAESKNSYHPVFKIKSYRLTIR